MAPPARLSLVIAEYREGLYIGLIKNFSAGLAKRRRQNSFKTIINNIHVHIGASLEQSVRTMTERELEVARSRGVQ